MAKPILFLDVDGVLNVWHNTSQCTVEYVMINSGTAWQACIPVGTKERLAKLLEVYEPVWATAWLGSAHGIFSPPLALSEEHWPHIYFTHHKVTEILKVAGNRPWAWIDDDAEWEFKDLKWEPHERFVDGLVIVPHPSIGITDEHVEKLLEFAKNA